MGPITVVASTWCAALGIVTLRAALPLRRPPAAAPPGDVLLLRPCAGLEPRLDEALASTAAAAPPGARVRFAIATPGDPARAAAERACVACVARGIDAQVVVTSAVGPNLKVDQLARVLARERAGEVVVVADSDVHLSADGLTALLRTVAAKGVGAAWAAPVEIEPATGADRASAAVLDASLHAFAVLASLDPGGMVGKLFAVRADALTRAGGMAPLAQHLGEDVELGRRLRAAGYAVRVTSAPAASLASGRSARAVIDRYTRWIAVVRAQRPTLLPAYPLVFAATPLIVALSLVGAWREGGAGLGVVAAALLLRGLGAGVAQARSGHTRARGPVVVDLALADALLLVAFTRAVTGRRVRWRGASLQLDGAGRLAVAEAP